MLETVLAGLWLPGRYLLTAVEEGSLHNRDDYAKPLDLVARWIESRGTA